MASKLSTLINALTGKTTPVDADKIPVLDSENSFNHNWLSFTQLKVYLATLYAPTAKGVTNGDSHDHSGGDGAQIAYSGLSGLPTLGTAAATASTAYATAAQGSTADTAVQPGDDAADLGSGAATDGYVLTADGAGGAAWEAAAVTYAGAASEIHAATEKTTPVDADELGLVDSAASWVLKRLTWANVKATLAGVFPLLAGKSGGQTLIGGTGVTDKLVLQGTSGNGTSAAKALEVNVGNNGGMSALTVLNNGNVGIRNSSPAQALDIQTGAIRFGYLGVPPAPSAVLADDGAGNVPNGTYVYRVSFINPLGVSKSGDISSSVTVSDNTINGKIRVTLPVSSDVTVTNRRLWRSNDGGSTWLAFSANTINNNTTTEYLDNTATPHDDWGSSPTIHTTGNDSGHMYADGNLFLSVNSVGASVFKLPVSVNDGFNNDNNGTIGFGVGFGL